MSAANQKQPAVCGALEKYLPCASPEEDRSQRKKLEIAISRFRDFDRRSSAPRVEMGNMCTFGRVRKPHGHVQADARSTRMGANRAGASAGRGGQAAAVERAGSVSASAGRGERTSAGSGGGARRRKAGAFKCLGGRRVQAAAVEGAGGGPVRPGALAARSGRQRRWGER